MGFVKVSFEELVRVHGRWPIEYGDYVVGAVDSPVAVAVLRCANEELVKQGDPVEKAKYELEQSLVQTAVNAGAAIAGVFRTANIGIEKMIANIVSNPNLRWLILVGLGENGHRAARALLGLWFRGVDEKTGKILEDVPRGYISNLSRKAIERFRKQVTLIPAIAKYEDIPSDAYLAEVTIGSKTFRIPVKGHVDPTNRYIDCLVVCAKYLHEIVAFLVHSCLQEPENKVVIGRIEHLYDYAYPVQNLVLYDPGALSEPPLTRDEIYATKVTAKAVPEVVTTTVTASRSVVSGRRSVKPRYILMNDDLFFVDFGWECYGRFRNIAVAYEFLKDYIIKHGISRPTRYGDTFEINIVEDIVEHPWFKFREENGRIIVEDYDFSYVEQTSYPLRDKEGLKKEYIEDILNGVWHDPGKVAYSYGAELRKFNAEVKVFFEKIIRDRIKNILTPDLALFALTHAYGDLITELFGHFADGDGILVVDQLQAVIDAIRKLGIEERCFIVSFWNPLLDTTAKRAQPCYVSIHFLYNPEDKTLDLICLMRSHDFLNAHLSNYYTLAALLQFVIWKLKQLEPEKFADLQPGVIRWVIDSCHIYKKHIGLA